MLSAQKWLTHTLICSSSLLLSLSAMAETNATSINPVSSQTRLISAGAGITELVLALGAGDELVAVDSTSVLPSSQASVAKLGYYRMLSAEGMLALEPTLVIGSSAMGPDTSLALLKSATIPVVKLPAANDRASLMHNIDILGQLLKRTSQANELKTQLGNSLDAIELKQQKIVKAESPKVLFILLQEGRPARVGGDDTAADIIIKLAGGENIAGFSGYKSLSQEGILSLQPELILISTRTQSTDEKIVTGSSFDAAIKSMPLLIFTPAGKNKHIEALPSEALLGGLALSAIEAADLLATKLLSIQQSR